MTVKPPAGDMTIMRLPRIGGSSKTLAIEIKSLN